MYRASKAVALAAKTGEPLPHVDFLRDMYEDGNELYRGSLVMIAGTFGSVKSMLALALVHEMGVPTLYISADSDAATQLSRLTAMTTGIQPKDIRTHLKDPANAGYISDALSASNVQFCFDSNPDAFDIEDELNAWVEMYDSYPEVIVVDNLRNVYSGQESEHGGYKAIQQQLITISRDTGACVITLHHMKESERRKKSDPAPSSAVDGMVNQLPGFILSAALEGDESRLCVIKDREAECHPDAPQDAWVRLRVDFNRATFHAKQSVNQIARRIENDVWSPTIEGETTT